MNEHSKGEQWDLARRVGNPCASPLVDSYPTFVCEGQKQVGVPVNQAAPPMLEHTHPHEPAKRHEVAGAGSSFADGPYLSDERHCPVCTRLFLDVQGMRLLLYSGVAKSEAPRVWRLDFIYFFFSVWLDASCFYRGGSSVGRPGLPGDGREPGGYGVHIHRAAD